MVQFESSLNNLKFGLKYVLLDFIWRIYFILSPHSEVIFLRFLESNFAGDDINSFFCALLENKEEWIFQMEESPCPNTEQYMFKKVKYELLSKLRDLNYTWNDK